MLTKRRGKLGRVFAIFMVVCLLVTYSGVSAFAGANDSIHLKDGEGFVFEFHLLTADGVEKQLTIPNAAGSYNVNKAYDDGVSIEDAATIEYCDVYLKAGYGTGNEVCLGTVESDYIGSSKSDYTLSTEGTMQLADGRKRFNAGNINIWYNGFKSAPGSSIVKFVKKWVDEDGNTAIPPEMANTLRFKVEDPTGQRITLSAMDGGQIQIKPSERKIWEDPTTIGDFKFKSVSITENGSKTDLTTSDGGFTYDFKAGKTYTVTYTNQYVDPDPNKDITITKEAVEPGELGTTAFPFTIRFDNLMTGYTAPAGATRMGTLPADWIDAGIKSAYSFSLTEGQSIVFAEIPKKVDYIVEESFTGVAGYYTSPIISGSLIEEPYPGYFVRGTVTTDAAITFANNKLEPRMEVEKTILNINGDKTFFIAGETIEYRIDVKNTGEVPLTNVVLHEMDGFDGPYASLTDAYDVNVSPGSVNVGGIAPNTTYSTFYIFRIPADTTAEKIDNTVRVTATEVPEGTDSKEAPIEHPDLSVEKKITINDNLVRDGEYTFEYGDFAQFTVIVKNDGAAPAKNVTLSDDFKIDGVLAMSNLKLEGASFLTEEQAKAFNLGTSTFEVPANGQVEFYFSAELLGMTAAEYNAEYEAIENGLRNNISAIEADIAASLQNLVASSGGIVTDEMDLGEAIEAIEDEIENLKEAKNATEDDAEKEAIQAEIDAWRVVLNGEGDVLGLKDLESNLEAAQDALADFETNGPDIEVFNTPATNEASVRYNTVNYPSNTINIKIKPQDQVQKAATVKKYVSLEDLAADASGWEDNLVTLGSDGDTVYYKIVITNNGTVAVTVTLEDDKYDGVNGTYTIPAGEEKVLLYSKDFDKNDDPLESESDTNVAKITYNNEDGVEQTDDDDAKVTVQPRPYIDLAIKKYVKHINDPLGTSWVDDEYSMYSDKQETFRYMVTVANNGNQTAKFTLSDTLLGGEKMYQDEALTTEVTGDTFTLDGGRSMTIYYSMSFTGKAGETVTKNNVVRYDVTEGDPKNDESDKDDDATVKLTPVPKIKLSLEKKVTTFSDYSANALDPSQANWKDSEPAVEISYLDSTAKFAFQITVTNEAVEGEGYPAKVNLTDVMSGCAINAGELTLEEALTDINVPANGSAVLYLFADVPVGHYTNIVTLTKGGITTSTSPAVEVSLPDGADEVTADADVTVTKQANPVIGIGIDKKVRLLGTTEWSDSVSYSGTSATVEFMVTVKANPGSYMGDYQIWGMISDTYGSKAEGLDGSPIDWSFMLEKNTSDEVNNFEKIIIYRVTFDGTGTYTNTATIGDEIGKEGVFDVTVDPKSDSASVTISTTGGGKPPHVPPTKPITETLVPLAETPVIKENPIVLVDPEVPLADIPQTGVEDMSFNLMMLGISLSALLAVLFGRKRGAAAKKENI